MTGPENIQLVEWLKLHKEWSDSRMETEMKGFDRADMEESQRVSDLVNQCAEDSAAIQRVIVMVTRDFL